MRQFWKNIEPITITMPSRYATGNAMDAVSDIAEAVKYVTKKKFSEFMIYPLN